MEEREGREVTSVVEEHLDEPSKTTVTGRCDGPTYTCTVLAELVLLKLAVMVGMDKPAWEGELTTPVREGELVTPVSEGELTTPVREGELITPVREGELITPVGEGELIIPVREGVLEKLLAPEIAR